MTGPCDAHAHLLRSPSATHETVRFLVPGTCEDIDATVSFEGDTRVLRAAGLHPWWVPADLAPREAALARLGARLRDGAVAIGETGLDRVRGPPRPTQEHAFRSQIELAKAHRLPLILHVVRAHGRALDLVRGARGMVHDFRGPIDMIEPWTRAGFFLSVSPRAARRPGPVLTAIPGRSLLIETDDEGPDALAAVIDALAAARRVPAATVIAQTAENFAALVGR